jgi:MshEN domain
MTQPPPLSPEEKEQILQTIEMFSVIVQASPNDAQSLEILRDAYVRAGQVPEAVQAARKLGEMFSGAEQYRRAMREFEYVLEHEPANVEVVTMLADIQEKVQQAEANGQNTEIDLDYGAAVGGNLMATSQTMKGTVRSAATVEAVNKTLVVEDGNEALVKFLLQHRIAPEDVVRISLDRVSKKNKDLAPNTMAHSLLDEVVRRGGLDLEATLCTIVDRSKLAYIPLEHYEVDRQIVKMLPENVTLGRLIVPFDVISRTLMVALANPFDAAGKDAVQQLLDFNVQWHIASPTAVTKVLSETYRVAAPGIIGADQPALKLATA